MADIPLQGIDSQLNGATSAASSADQEYIKLGKSIKAMTEPVKGLNSEIKKAGDIFREWKLPFLDKISSSMSSVNSFSNSLENLSKDGMGQANQMAGLLKGSMGLWVTAGLAVTKTMKGFYDEMVVSRLEIAKASFSLQDFSKTQEKTSEAYKIASKTVTDYGANIDEVNKAFTNLSSAGINLSVDDMSAFIEGTIELQKALQISNGTLNDSFKLISQEYGIRDKAVMSTIKLTKGLKDLGIGTDDYLKRITNLSKGFLDLGISAETINNDFHDVVVSFRSSHFGLTRATEYTKEMIGGPLESGLGQRAYLAQLLGIGNGNALGGAGMLKYAPGTYQGVALGEKVIDYGLKNVAGISGEQFMGAKKEDKYGYAEMVAQFAEQFGISERTTMEAFNRKFGLAIRTPQLTTDEKQLKELEEETKLMRNQLGLWEKIGNVILSGKYNIIQGTQTGEAGTRKFNEQVQTTVMKNSGKSQDQINYEWQQAQDAKYNSGRVLGR